MRIHLLSGKFAPVENPRYMRCPEWAETLCGVNITRTNGMLGACDPTHADCCKLCLKVYRVREERGSP